LVAHPNLLHPNRIQVLGNHEIAHLAAFGEAELFQTLGNLFAVHPVAIVVADGAPADVRMLKAAEASGTAVFATDLPGAQVIDQLRRYLGKALAETTQCHGVCMDEIATQLRSEEHTSELQSRFDLVCRLLLEKKKKISRTSATYGR